MKMTATLSRYLARMYIVHVLFLFMALMGIIYLFDTVELIRRASKFSDVPLGLVLQMGLLKLPEVAQVLFPFAILFSAMFTFWQLTRRYELIVARAAGFSAWQFLAPFIGVAVMLGVLQMAIFNPIGSLLLSKFEQLENTHLKRQDSQIALFEEGFWLRQSDDQGYVIMHSIGISQADWALKNVTALFFDQQDGFRQRVDAPVARLEKGRWLFQDAVISGGAENKPLRQANFVLPTGLTVKDVEDSFASPETMSFWRLPAHIKTLEETGFNASRLKVHYQNLLAQPLMFAAMILLAAAFSMRPPRSRGTFALVTIGVFIGFFVFFMSSFLQALGASQQVPVFLAAWAPAVVSFLLGVSVMMSLEDG